MAAHLDRAATGGGARAMVSLTYIAADAEARIDRVRRHTGDTGGASLLARDVLVCRLLAPSGYVLRQHLLPILDDLTGGHLPLCWRL